MLLTILIRRGYSRSQHELVGLPSSPAHSLDQTIVVSMRPDPEPYRGITGQNAHRAPVDPHPDRIDRLLEIVPA